MHDKQTGVRVYLIVNYPWLLLAGLVITSLFFNESLNTFLHYQRESVLEGGIYRLITAHLVHTNTYHGLLNLFGLIVIGALSNQQLKPRDWGWGILICMLCVSTGLLIFEPQLHWYRGLSGVLHGMLVILIFRARQMAWFIRFVMFGILVLKVLLEQAQLGLWETESPFGAPVVVDAHLYGLLGGLVAYLILQMTRSKRMFREQF